MKEMKVSWTNIMIACDNIAATLQQTGYKPNVVIALSRGGTIAGTILSHMLKCDMAVIAVKRYRDTEKGVKDDWLSSNERIAFIRKFKPNEKILIVDDIIDEFVALPYAIRLVHNTLPLNPYVRVSALYSKDITKTPYYGFIVDKKTWVVFPWER